MLVVLIFVIVFIFWWNKEIIISKNGTGKILNTNGIKSSIAGLECDLAKTRPFAVMLAGDLEARPLSGIGQADIVFEMPVAPNGVTRFMAVYQCEIPKEIGSVRSSRKDFIPLAKGLKAVYVHWGGEHEALNMLNGGVIDNIDALKYEGTIFYRKKGIPAPHDGFTDMDLLTKKAIEFKYSFDDKFVGYIHADKVSDRRLSNLTNLIEISYPKPFDVTWVYDQTNNIYKRVSNGKPEIDKSTNKQVAASVVILMKTKIIFWRDQYMRVDVQGQGDAQVYQGGVVINGKWKKDASDTSSKLTFVDQNGQEIKFLPGKIWVEIVSNN